MYAIYNFLYTINIPLIPDTYSLNTKELLKQWLISCFICYIVCLNINIIRNITPNVISEHLK